MWRVVDADEVADGGTPAGDEAPTEPARPAGPTGAPWYQAMWESVQVTDARATTVGRDEGDGVDVEPGGTDGGE